LDSGKSGFHADFLECMGRSNQCCLSRIKPAAQYRGARACSISVELIGSWILDGPLLSMGRQRFLRRGIIRVEAKGAPQQAHASFRVAVAEKQLTERAVQCRVTRSFG